MPGSKQCSRCQTVKPLDDFGTQRTRGKLKVNSRCKTCASEIATEWRLANRERYNRFFREWRKNSDNKARSKAWIEDWQARNPDKKQAHNAKGKAKRRARMAQTKDQLTTTQWRERVAEFNGHCAYCLKPWTEMHMEHMHPVSRGGEHSLNNVIPACGDCNRAKGSRTLLEFAFGLTPSGFTSQKDTHNNGVKLGALAA
jgi:5-methylcytosine-specific restriction endonuclease McrA